MKQMFIGIDLGTTNSAIAYFDGDATGIIANAYGENLTPSVVRIDQHGSATVGRQANRYIDTDPSNTCKEFKRLMGSEIKLQFPRAGKEMLPEEVSELVLRSLLTDAADTLGFIPKRAVISTPALFELPQNHATMRAGTLAGLEEVLLIQEPVASAIAAGWHEETTGMWLIFDLGGGTLDVSLLETKEGRLRIVDHSGDNFLGGKDFDNALVDWVLAKLHEQYTLPELNRANPESRPFLNRLKAACEQAKIELSRQRTTDIFIPDFYRDAAGQTVDVDIPVNRTDYEQLIEPLIERGLDVCLEMLKKGHVSVDEVAHIVFIGGPTLTPLLHRRIGDVFNGRIAEGIDPMTAVARGAALYATTAGLAAGASKPGPECQEGMVVRIEFPPVTADLEPFVIGRFLPKPNETLPIAIRIVREDGSEVSPECTLSNEGSFVQQITLKRHVRNSFRLQAYDDQGREITLQSADFSIVHGISVSDPPLSRSIGVALANDTVQVYFKKGTALPARKTFSHRTIRSVKKDSDEDVLSIPIVQGEYHRAHRNCLIGRLAIGKVNRKLPSGSRVEVTLHLDRSGQLHAQADIPSISQRFEDIVHILVPTATRETLEKEFASTENRCNVLLQKGFSTADKSTVIQLEKVPFLLTEARSCIEAVSGGDQDAMQRLHRLLLEINATLDKVEERIEWPTLVEEANEQIEIALSWVSAWGNESEQRLLDRAIQAATAAGQSADPLELDRQVKAIKAVTISAARRNPDSVFYEFDWYLSNATAATDVPKASQLMDKGRRAVSDNDRDSLREINHQLHQLFPGTEEERARSYGSGVH